MSDLSELAAMFDGRSEGPSYPSGVGWMPFWPTARDVWAARGELSEDRRSNYGYGTFSADPRCWAQAWELLQRLEAEYRAAKQR